MTTQANTHPEIEQYREHLHLNRGVSFMFNLERQSYEENIRNALTREIPRLYALEFEDETDVPAEVYRLIDILERDLGINLEWEEE